MIPIEFDMMESTMVQIGSALRVAGVKTGEVARSDGTLYAVDYTFGGLVRSFHRRRS